MASKRILPHLLWSLRPSLLSPQKLILPGLRIRNYTTLPSPVRYDFTAIKALPSNKILIDVREPFEFAAGAIPGAVNLPLTSAPEALALPEDEFEDRFGFSKPAKNVGVVFYCKGGIRSNSAAYLAIEGGYTDVGEYPGSWLDWVKKTNEAA